MPRTKPPYPAEFRRQTVALALPIPRLEPLAIKDEIQQIGTR